MLVIQLEGVLGFHSELKPLTYQFRYGALDGLVLLSQLFRIVLVSKGFKQKRLKALCNHLSFVREQFHFDAVYKVQRS